MTDISRFGFAIDSSQVVTAFQNLDRLTESSRRMEERARRLEQSAQELTRGFRELARQQEAYNQQNQLYSSAVPAIIEDNRRLAESYSRLSAEILAVNAAMAQEFVDRWKDRQRGISPFRMLKNEVQELWDIISGSGGRDATNVMHRFIEQAESLQQNFEVSAREMRLYTEAADGLQITSLEVAQVIEHIGRQSEGTSLQVSRLRENLNRLGLDLDELRGKDEIETFNTIGQQISGVRDVRERSRLARELGFSPEALAAARIGLREIGEEQRKLFAMQEATARMQQQWEEEQAGRQRRRLEIIKEIEAREQQAAQASYDALVKIGHAWEELWQGAGDPTQSFFERISWWLGELGTKLENLGDSIADYYRALVDPETYAQNMLERGDLDETTGSRDPIGIFLSRMDDQLRDRLSQLDAIIDPEVRTEVMVDHLNERLELLRESYAEEAEIIRQTEQEKIDWETRSALERKRIFEEQYNRRMSIALSALEKEIEAGIRLQRVMENVDGVYTRMDLRRALWDERMARMARVEEDRYLERLDIQSRAAANVASARVAHAGAQRAAATGAAPRVGVTGAELAAAQAQHQAQMDLARHEMMSHHQRLMERGYVEGSEIYEREMRPYQNRIDDLRTDFEATRQIIAMQAGLNADMAQYQEERRLLLMQESLMWAEEIPERRRLMERLATAEVELAEEYGRGTAAFEEALARRKAVIEEQARVESQLGLATTVGDMERQIQEQEGLAEAYEKGAQALRDFNIQRQVSMQAAILAATGHDMESEAVQNLLDQYERSLREMDRQAAQQRAGAAMAARNRDREAMRYETGLARSGVLSLRRGRMTELFRFEQSLRDEGLPQEDVQRHLADYSEYLNEAAVRDFETEKADRLINAARQAAYQIENVLSQGLVSAAAHGTQGFEQFFHSIGQMAQQTAAEILKVMVIRPMMAWSLQSMGLGSLAAELGLAALTMHSGGVVGSDGYVRMVPASLIAGAPRYHSGTASAGGPATGLAPNEVLTILKKGEQVIPEGGSAGSLNVVNNISINNNGPGTQNEAASEQMAKTIIKQIDIYMEKKMSSFVVRQMRHNGLFN